MMAQQGKQRPADRLRPEERHDLAALRRPGCPTIIETSSKKKLAGEPVAIGDVCFKRDGVFAMELGGPGGRPRLRRARHHPRLRAAGEARLPRMGLRLRPARLPGRRGLRRLRPADRPRHVPEGHRRRLERPAVALRRQQRLLGGRVFPQDGRQRRRRRPRHQQGRRHRRGAGVRGGGRHPGPGRDPGRRGHPPQERQLRDHRPARRALGAAVRGTRAATSPTPPPRRPTPLTQDESARPVQGRGGRAATSCSSPPPSTTCAASAL